MDIFEAEMVRRFVVAVEKIANALDRKDEPRTSGLVWTEDAIKNELKSYTTWASTDEPQPKNLFTDKDGDVWEWRGDAWYCISGQDEPWTDCPWK